MRNLSNIGQVAELTLNNGSSLRYLKAGSGAPMILLHTIRTQLDYFQAVIPTLARHYTVYAVDLPGHGYSSIDTKASYDEPYFRAAIVAFIEKLDLNNVTLVGESIGGVIALTVSARLPNRIKKVTTVNPYDYETRYGDGLRRGNFVANFIIGHFGIPILGAIFAALENKFLLGLVMRGGLRNIKKMPNDLLTEFNKVGFRKGYRYVERKTLAGWRTWAKARNDYLDVKVPLKLIYAQYDWSKQAERERTAKLLNTTFITVPETGHFTFVDNPEKMSQLLLEG
ncbi:MAG TPA: alpha/beta hydrolase [Methylotenera sp.]|nr:alpha/beta hydrolase [Methylotenera sp.]HPH04271.1 alpha/beta hydrolase [Methylotenera sp.]HPM99825.1 alpha/beta hydrolase [Methylotenera sp.]